MDPPRRPSRPAAPLVKPLHAPSALALPVLISIVAGTSLVVVLLLVYCAWRCCRPKRVHGISTPTSPDPASHRPSLAASSSSSNIKISQSVPDLKKDDSNRGDMIHAEERIGKSHYKTVIKQLTMPNMAQRHLNFQRQLSHKLDLGNVEFAIHSVKYKEQPAAGRIKPELYRQNAQETMASAGRLGSSATLSDDVKFCGKLFFTLHYVTNAESLVVSVLKAEGLPAKDFSGTSDPYVKIYLLPDRKNKFQTKVHRKTLNPEFNENFVFIVPYRELQTRILQFSIYDFDRFSRHDLIGVVMVKHLGVEMDLSWEQPFVLDVICVQHEQVDLGELMMSLCYLPTAGRLTITVIKARNLKAMDITGTSDPYVKVSLMCHGRRIRKKKTSVKKGTLNPVYNEAIVFDVPQENIEEVSLIIKVIDYDRVGSNELMGCCAVGLRYFGTGRDHWFEMLENTRRPVAQWYGLQEHVPGGTQHDHDRGGDGEEDEARIRDVKARPLLSNDSSTETWPGSPAGCAPNAACCLHTDR